MMFTLGDEAAGVVKRGRPSASIDWACPTVIKNVVRCLQPYLSHIEMHVVLFQTAFVNSSRVWRGMGPSAVDFFHRFLQSLDHVMCPPGLVGTRSSRRVAFLCPSTPQMRPQ